MPLLVFSIKSLSPMSIPDISQNTRTDNGNRGATTPMSTTRIIELFQPIYTPFRTARAARKITKFPWPYLSQDRNSNRRSDSAFLMNEHRLYRKVGGGAGKISQRRDGTDAF